MVKGNIAKYILYSAKLLLVVTITSCSTQLVLDSNGNRKKCSGLELELIKLKL